MSSQQTLFITEIADPNDNSKLRYVELYSPDSAGQVISDDLYLQRWTNEKPSPTTSSNISLKGETIGSDGFLVVAANKALLDAEFGTGTADINGGTGGPADSNGDDQIALVEISNSSTTIVDLFGIPGEDGSGTNHEFEDGLAERKSTSTTPSNPWVPSEWNVFSDAPGSTIKNVSDLTPRAWSGAGPVVDPASIYVHGVASGDPYDDSVILWTRYSPDAPSRAGRTDVTLDWEISTNSNFQSIVDSGTFTTNADRDWTVKVEADGLQPGQDYYYRFKADGAYSPVGQTNTLPDSSASEVRLAVFSCANLAVGAGETQQTSLRTYGRAAQLDAARDYDAMIHLGDYIYEHGDARHQPTTELNSLSDYRQRLGQYRSNADLQAAHASNPFITIWDDHEIANDSYKDGADQHDPNTEGSWIDRRDAALQAYYEWMPIREPLLREGTDLGTASTPLTQGYRSFDFGDLVSLHMMEPRLSGRDQQFNLGAVAYPAPVPDDAAIGARLTAILTDPTLTAQYLSTYSITATDSAAIQQALTLPVTLELIQAGLNPTPPRTMLGSDQKAWLKNEIDTSTATWQLLGSTGLMQSMEIPVDLLQGFAPGADQNASLSMLDRYADSLLALESGSTLAELSPTQQANLAVPKVPYYTDSWDGYAAEREEILQHASGQGKSLLTIAGDTHNAWAGHLTLQDDTATGFEFATPGVSSQGFDVYVPVNQYLDLTYPQLDGLDTYFEYLVDSLEYADTRRRGYLDLTITEDQAVGSFQLHNAESDTWSNELVTGTRANLSLTQGLPPAANLFISEYAEGSYGNNKYLEIYNASSDAVNLDDYGLATTSNGADQAGEFDSWYSFESGASIAAGDVYVIANSGAEDKILAKADETSGALNVNGDDAIALAQGASNFYRIIDQIGDFGADPGSGWQVAGVDNATADLTLMRKGSVVRGNTDWDASRGTTLSNSEWTLHAAQAFLDDGLDSLGGHAFGSPPASLPPEQLATIPTLFISEYAEGSGNNKYFEIFNPTDQSVSLSDYSWVTTSNFHTPGEWEFQNTFPDGAQIVSLGSYVVAHKDADSLIRNASDDDRNTLYFNGDDSIALIQGDPGGSKTMSNPNIVVVDVIGDFNGDPGSGWPVASDTNGTADQTLIRKPHIVAGNTDWAESSGTSDDDSEWLVLSKDNFKATPSQATPGSHTIVPLAGSSSPTVSYQDIIPLHDAHVARNAPTLNSGQNWNLYVASDAETDPSKSRYGDQRGWVQYPLSDQIPANANLTDAKLRFYVLYADNDADFDLSVHLGSDRWDEHTLTWANQPQFLATELSSATLIQDQDHTWYEVDVTDEVLRAMDDDNLISFVLKSSVEGLADSESVRLDSKDYTRLNELSGILAPTLRLGYDTAPVSDGGLEIIHFNDVHSRVQPHDFDFPSRDDQTPDFENAGGAAELAAAVIHLKTQSPHALVLDAGDMSEGGPVGDQRGNGGTLDVLQELDSELKLLGGRGIDALVVGNHDVRYKSYIDELSPYDSVNNPVGTNLPVISVNLLHDSTHADEALRGTTYWDPYVIVETGGADSQKVGIIGYSTDESTHLGPETEDILDVAKVVWSDDDKKTIDLKDYVLELRNEHQVDSVVLLSHVGQKRINAGDEALLVDTGDVKLPEVVVSGHWHTMTDTAWQPANLNHNTTVVEAASYTQYVGKLELDQSGKYVSATKHPIKTDDLKIDGVALTPNTAVQAVVDGLVAEYAANQPAGAYQLEDIVGFSGVDLSLDKDKWFTVSEFPWSGDNTAGFWTADSMHWKANELGYGADIALQSGGGLRRSVQAGPVTYREIYETYPWRDDHMVLIEIEGDDLWEFLERKNAGASISQGWSIKASDGVLESVTYNGQPLDRDATYKAVISEYMFKHERWLFGGDNNPDGYQGGDFADTTPDYLIESGSNVSIRDSMIEYTAQFDVNNPMDIPGPRYDLDTEFAGGFKAVVTMLADSESHPYFESAFVRLLEPTAETLARNGRYGLDLVLDDQGNIDPDAQFSETMLYRSHLGIPNGRLKVGDIIEIWGEGGFHEGNPQFIDQSGIVHHGEEFIRHGHDISLAQPEIHDTIASFWNEEHENHLVRFTGIRRAYNTIEDANGQRIEVFKPGGYYEYPLPGSNGDVIELTGVNTFRNDASYSSARYPARRFRAQSAVLQDQETIVRTNSQLDLSDVSHTNIRLDDKLDSIAFTMGRGSTFTGGRGKDIFKASVDRAQHSNDRIRDFQIGLDELIVTTTDGSTLRFDHSKERSDFLTHAALSGLSFDFTPDLRTAKGKLHAISGQTSLFGAGLRIDKTDEPLVSAELQLSGGLSLELMRSKLPDSLLVEDNGNGTFFRFSPSNGHSELHPAALRRALDALHFEGHAAGSLELTITDEDGLVATTTNREVTLLQPRGRASAGKAMVKLDGLGADLAFTAMTDVALKVAGTSGDDAVRISATPDGRNSAFGLAGADTLSAPQGGSLDGGDGADILIGAASPDHYARLLAGDGDDQLIGGMGDKLNGEGGNDTLMALGANNFLIGGLGSDRFVIKDNHTTGGRNTILDFTPGVDQLVIAGTAAGSKPSVLFEATSAGVAVTIAGDSSPAAMLSGLRPSSLEAARDVAYISSSLSAPLLTAVADVQQLHQSL